MSPGPSGCSFAFDAAIRQYVEPGRGASHYPRLQRAAAHLAYRTEETNFTLGLAELNARLKRRALVVLFTEFVDAVMAELLLESLRRMANGHAVIFVTLRDPLTTRLIERDPRNFHIVAEAVVAHDFARERAIVLERIARLAGLGDFFRRGFPAAVRKGGWPILISFLALLVGVAAGFLLVLSNEGWFNALVPDDLAAGRGPGVTADQLRHDELFQPWPGFRQTFIVFANYLFRHNSLVAILSFGLGFMAGVPTLLLMVYQGLVLGAFAAIHFRRGLLVEFLGWISIHGVTEIGAFVLCGAAGLVVAEKILFPGRYSRLENLAIHGREAAMIVGGAVAMLFVAGIIKGGFRQLIDFTAGRFAFAAVTAVLWLYYFLASRGEGSLGLPA